MIEIDAKKIAEVTGGELLSDDAGASRVAKGLVWDTRELAADNIFLAVAGARVDGNDFIAQAAMAGAGCVVCTRRPSDAACAVAGEFSCPIVVVDDAIEAISALAGWWRAQIRAIVVGVTGSTGKTSTKDLVAAVLRRSFNVVATQANHNNELGVPQTVLAAAKDTEVLVVEMGMRGAGQIEKLCAFVKPSVGIITNVGVAHMELLGSQDAIARAKAELPAALPPDGLAVLNADDPRTPLVREAAGIGGRGPVCKTFGLSETADVRACEVSMDADACASFYLDCDDGKPPRQVHLAVPGRHNVENALAAACVASYLGMPAEKIAAGLADVRPSGMRMQIVRGLRGATFVNDAYNANPDSMDAALVALRDMECAGKRVAVLGDMGELGADERELHAQVGQRVAQLSIDRLVCVGTLSAETASAAVEAGMPAGAVQHFDDVAGAASWLAEHLDPADIVLVKASRFMGLEKIVEEAQRADV